MSPRVNLKTSDLFSARWFLAVDKSDLGVLAMGYSLDT
jgi:hypothetical protein